MFIEGTNDNLILAIDKATNFPFSIRYSDVSNGAIWDDVVFLCVGYMVVYMYVQMMLGKFNRVEQRVKSIFFTKKTKLIHIKL